MTQFALPTLTRTDTQLRNNSLPESSSADLRDQPSVELSIRPSVIPEQPSGQPRTRRPWPGSRGIWPDRSTSGGRCCTWTRTTAGTPG